ncbi:MAG: glycosyltransferase family 2 protein [Phycisphaerales bacterium]|nr:glycosyltransferase family 2 protein [Phycisphaerales bacterium]
MSAVTGYARADVPPTLSVIIVVYNRREAVLRTIGHLDACLGQLAGEPNESPGADPVWAGFAEVIVVDNASTDGSAAAVREVFPLCRVIELEANTGVEAFNRGVAAARGTHLLILDDDAWPEARGLGEGLAAMEQDDTLGAVMLQPVHPRTGTWEWPFDRVAEREANWPDLRCANLVRREAWERVGGYESGFFLYRNDTDLALKLLGAGYDVVYDPSWRAMHDSPHITVRRLRWFVLSTRNWVWMCRRHARRLGWVIPGLMGWLWAHRLAGWSVARQWAAFRGGVGGFLVPGPRVPPCVRRDGKGLTRLIELKRRLRNKPHRSMTGS